MRYYFCKKKEEENIIIAKPYADYCNTCSILINKMKIAESESEADDIEK
jgi:hypothetical protein